MERTGRKHGATSTNRAGPPFTKTLGARLYKGASQRILKDVLANGSEAADLRGNEFHAAVHVPL